MDNQSGSQLELFSKSTDYGVSKPELPRNSFFRYLRTHEKAILTIIGFVTIAIISFSLGVEKGRKLASSKILPERAALPAREQPVVEVSGQKQESVPVSPDSQYGETDNLAKKAQDKLNVVALGQYTVQLASYKTKEYAQKEAELLKKKGFTPLILTKGDYIVLCVGNFADKMAANSLLSELKKLKRYSGCLIRRL